TRMFLKEHADIRAKIEAKVLPMLGLKAPAVTPSTNGTASGELAKAPGAPGVLPAKPVALATAAGRGEEAGATRRGGRRAVGPTASPPPAGGDVTSPIESEELASCREAALKLLDRTLRTRRELERRLKEKDFDAATIEGTLGRLAAVGLVDDVEYARAWL